MAGLATPTNVAPSTEQCRVTCRRDVTMLAVQCEASGGTVQDVSVDSVGPRPAGPKYGITTTRTVIV